jgi:hypothetical protein
MRFTLFLIGAIAICAYRPEWIVVETTPWHVQVLASFGTVWAMVGDIAEVVLKVRRLK